VKLAATFTATKGLYGNAVNSVAFLPDGTPVVGTGSGISFWDTATGKIAAYTVPGERGAQSVALGPHGILAIADGPRTYLWNTAAGTIAAAITGPSASVAFGPRGTVATWAGRHCYLWDITYHQD
jgi:WD40 repeat protein